MLSALPAGTVDNHAHVLDPTRSAVTGAAYAPFPATLTDYADHLARLGVRRGVLVTASTHGTDNGPLLDALSQAKNRSGDQNSIDLRGVAVVGTGVTDDELATMHGYGVRAIRLQDQFAGGAPLEAIREMGRRIGRLGWHIEIWTDFARHLDWLPEAIDDCGVPVVLDHIGYMAADTPNDHRPVRTMLSMARAGQVWITLSGAYRLAPEGTPTAAGRALVSRVELLVESVGDRLLWGSDWPHVAPPNGAPETIDLLREIDLWLTDEHIRHRILVANAWERYGFE